MHFLLVEDDAEVSGYLVKGLKEEGFTVDHAADGAEGLQRATANDYDLMIIDRMLPQVDGLDIVRRVRASGKNTPVLILSALGEVDDRVEGLQAGSDDYLTKPFAYSELSARIHALLRRGMNTAAPVTELKVGDLRLDLLTHTATRADKLIELEVVETVSRETVRTTLKKMNLSLG